MDLSTIGKSELRLPYIAKGGGGTFDNKKKSVAMPPKKDFFKLVTPVNVEIEQNDQAIKQYYGTNINTKFKMAELGIQSPMAVSKKRRQDSIKQKKKIMKLVEASKNPQEYAYLSSDHDEFVPN